LQERVRSAVTGVAPGVLNARQITSSELSSSVSCVEERLTSCADHPAASGEQQHRRQMSGCTVLEQKHGGARPTCRRSERVKSQMCLHARVILNCTPDHEFRTYGRYAS
jgi:hypothetical protein